MEHTAQVTAGITLSSSLLPGSSKVGGKGEKEQRWGPKTWKQEQKQIQEHTSMWVHFYFIIIILWIKEINTELTFPLFLNELLSTFFLSQVNDTRVILEDSDPNVVGSDYINGNYVKVRIQSHWAHRNTAWQRHRRKLWYLLLWSLSWFRVCIDSLCVCRTNCRNPKIRKFTLPLRGV